jgi:hydroxymethylglutaryl-CoA lyase
MAAISAGAGTVDGSLGGLGGCPFAPGAGGNTATEDLLFAIRPPWFAPPTLAVLLGLSDELLTDLGEPNRSRTADGARSTTTAFPWALAAGALNERL